MKAAQSFEELCLDAAERFVQSAIVVDNDSGFGPEKDTSPKVANAKLPPGTEPGAAEKDEGSEAEPPGKRKDTHYLDYKALGEAFLERKIVCGTYCPTANEGMVDTTCKAASTADIAVIDWHLQGNGGGSLKAKEIISAILKSDKSSGPRLRLIAVYTAQQGLIDLATELRDYLEDEGIDDISLEEGSSVLVSKHLRIAFINKQATMAHVVGDPIAEESELPGLLLKEYAKLARGILPSTAMSAIADIRKATPHLLTIFHSDLDGAYVGHRAMIPFSEDSEPFLRRMVTDELDAVIETAGTMTKHAGTNAIRHWLQELSSSGHKFKSGDDECDLNNVQSLVDFSGNKPLKHDKELKNKIKEAFSTNTPGPIYSEFAKIFYENDSHKELLLEFSRLCNLKRENNFRSKLNNDWRPILSLGTIVKPIIPENETDNTDFDKLLLCVQPRCDSVRLEYGSPRKFAFISLNEKENPFNYVIDDDGMQKTYKSDINLYNVKSFSFESHAPTVQTVRAFSCGNKMFFIDSNSNAFEWIADVKDLQAQHAANELGSNASRVGYDEHEWLRLKSKKS